MGRLKQHPRYNVLSCRVSDEIRQCVDHARERVTVDEYIRTALEEKLIRDRQERINQVCGG